jgi:hypothetical protein
MKEERICGILCNIPFSQLSKVQISAGRSINLALSERGLHALRGVGIQFATKNTSNQKGSKMKL